MRWRSERFQHGKCVLALRSCSLSLFARSRIRVLPRPRWCILLENHGLGLCDRDDRFLFGEGEPDDTATEFLDRVVVAAGSGACTFSCTASGTTERLGVETVAGRACDFARIASLLERSTWRYSQQRALGGTFQGARSQWARRRGPTAHGEAQPLFLPGSHGWWRLISLRSFSPRHHWQFEGPTAQPPMAPVSQPLRLVSFDAGNLGV